MSNPPLSGPDLTELTRSPRSTFLWGSSRGVTKRVLYALARANDPRLFWLDIRARAEEKEDPNPARAGWVPEDRLFVAHRPEEVRPQDTVNPLTLWSVVRSDEPKRVLSQLSDFLRLPPIAQEVIARGGTGPGSHVVVVSNVDRVRQFYPQDPTSVRAVIEPFLAASILPFFGSNGTPGEGRWAFDFVFEVRAESLRSWEKGWLICEQAPTGSAFRSTRSFPLGSLPEVAEVLYGDDPLP